MKTYYLDTARTKKANAGQKAPKDIAKLCKNRNFIQINMPILRGKSKLLRDTQLLTTFQIQWIILLIRIKSNSMVIFQYPKWENYSFIYFYMNLIKKIKKCKFIAIIHDLESLREEPDMKKHKKIYLHSDNQFLPKFDYIICHNNCMKQYLISKGIDKNKLINLDIFDYLVELESNNINKYNNNSIIIAGNLKPSKSGYIYKLIKQETKLNIQLYGINFEAKDLNDNVNYMGSFSPDELPNKLQGKYGLIWDGSSIKSCKGNTGEYLRYNNPHKTSLYLAAGIPVIIWKEAAMATFILKNNLGIAVESLENLETVLANISEKEYIQMKKNAEKIGIGLRNGKYFYKALDKCIV